MKSARGFETPTWNEMIGTGGDDWIEGTAGADRIWGFDGRDFLLGRDGDDVIDAGAGDDLLEGGAGDDFLIGGEGDDLMTGGAGMDSFDGGDGFDIVAFADTGAFYGIVADLRSQTILNDGRGNVENLSSVEGFGEGTHWADVFYGDAGANSFNVGVGDFAYGFEGDDRFIVDSVLAATIDGGAGNDTIFKFTQLRQYDHGGWVEYQSPTQGVFVNLAGQWIVDGFGGTATVSGIENVGGSDRDDLLIGDAGANALVGFGGDDMLRGGEGSDTLTGGGGADEFQFITGLSGHDRVTDFSRGVDHLSFLGVAGLDDFSDLGIGHDAAGDVVVSWGLENSVTLVGVSEVFASDFLFG